MTTKQDTPLPRKRKRIICDSDDESEKSSKISVSESANDTKNNNENTPPSKLLHESDPDEEDDKIPLATLFKKSSDSDSDEDEDKIPLATLYPNLAKKLPDYIDVDDDDDQEIEIERKDSDEEVELETKDPEKSVRELESLSTVDRSIGSLSLEKRLGVFKALLRVDDVVVANKRCKLLGDGEFTVTHLTPAMIALYGPSPKDRGDAHYRIHWKRFLAYVKQGDWQFSRHLTSQRGKRRREQKLIVSSSMLIPKYESSKDSYYEHVMLKSVLCRNPLRLQKERRDAIYSQALQNIFKDEPNFKRFGPHSLSQLMSLYDKFYFPGVLALLKTIRKGKLRFEVNSRMKSVAGMCLDRRDKPENDVLIKISQLVIMGLKFPMITRINGVQCENRLQVLLSVFEHELVHAILMLFCPISMSGFNGGHTLAFQHMVKTFFNHDHYKHELLVGDIKEYDQKNKETVKESKSLKKRLKIGSVMYLHHVKKQLVQWSLKKELVKGWKGEIYQVLKKNPKRLIVLYHKDIRKGKDVVLPSKKTLLLDIANEGEGSRHERYTIPYTYLVNSERT